MKKILDNLRKSFMNYLERMEKINKELYGNKKPDCCSLNSGSGKTTG